MNDNRVSASLSQADVDAVMAAIATIRQKLPFLLDLTPEERRALPKLGDKSRAFVRAALTVARQNPDLLPRYFDVDEMSKDVNLIEALDPIYAETTQLYELLEDTHLAVAARRIRRACSFTTLPRRRVKALGWMTCWMQWDSALPANRAVTRHLRSNRLRRKNPDLEGLQDLPGLLTSWLGVSRKKSETPSFFSRQIREQFSMDALISATVENISR